MYGSLASGARYRTDFGAASRARRGLPAPHRSSLCSRDNLKRERLHAIHASPSSIPVPVRPYAVLSDT